ncbi:hexameric tyrosine-coordinated heme protein [Streptomyces sp. NPDC002677]|uniref:hexameric tyrosine-coordinated heme protein n=1 Tax=Streptomyces sp. NPDC002677 TaxID=3154774 RepID=UPI00331C8309
MATEVVPGNTLITASPQEGRELPLKMARLVIKATQPDGAVREQLRPEYAQDADSLISIAHVVAVEFATIAAANDYWR